MQKNTQDSSQQYQQVEPAPRHYHEPIAPHSQDANNKILMVFGLMWLSLVVVGLIYAHTFVVQASTYLIIILLGLSLVAVPTSAVYLLWHKWYMDSRRRRHAELDRLAKKQQIRHDEERHKLMLDETQLVPDIAGNYPAIVNRLTSQVIYIQPGQYIPNVPHTYSPSNRYDYKDTSTRVSEEQQGVLGQNAASLSLPRIEEFYDAIPFNSLQVGLGRDMKTKQLVIGSIEKSVHFKLVGGSDFGKSCLAGGILDIATTTNDPDHLRVGLLDLEYNTSKLFEELPHIAEIGPRRQRLIGRDPDEVAEKLKLLYGELQRRERLGEAYCREHEPMLLVYVEEMLALKYEVVNEKLKKEMLAAINILGVRGRKYLIFFLACMQTDYSDKSTREAMAQYRTRGGFAIDPDTARAAGFFNTDLVKQNFQASRKGQYVLERPSYSGIVLAPDYDVKAKLIMLSGAANKATNKATNSGAKSPYQSGSIILSGSDVVVTPEIVTTGASQANVLPLSAQERRILKKYREMSVSAIVASEFTDASGKELTGGRMFTEKCKEIQALVARFLPIEEEA